jgi:hypothetical protein
VSCPLGKIYGHLGFQEGDWYILKPKEGEYSGYGSHWFWHKCEDGGTHIDKTSMPWLVYYYTVPVSHSTAEERHNPEEFRPRWMCCRCGAEPSSDILGVYMLLEMDQCANEMKEAEKQVGP